MRAWLRRHRGDLLVLGISVIIVGAVVWQIVGDISRTEINSDNNLPSYAAQEKEQWSWVENERGMDYLIYQRSDDPKIFRLKSFGGPISCRLDNDDWVAIDTRIVPSTTRDFEMVRAPYQVYLLSDPEQPKPVELVRVLAGSSYSISYKPISLGWVGLTATATPTRPSTGASSEDEFAYSDIFGPGTDLRYELRNTSMKELLEIRDVRSIPLAPPGTTALELRFAFEFTEGLECVVDGRRWDKSSRVETDNQVYFTFKGENMFWMGRPYAYDDVRGRTSLTYVLEAVGRELHVSLLVPYPWLSDKSRIYPITIDPTTFVSSASDGFIEGYGEGLTYEQVHDLTAGEYLDDQGFYLVVRQENEAELSEEEQYETLTYDSTVAGDGWSDIPNVDADGGGNATTTSKNDTYWIEVDDTTLSGTIENVTIKIDAWCSRTDAPEFVLGFSVNGSTTNFATQDLNVTTSEAAYEWDITGLLSWTVENLNALRLSVKSNDPAGPTAGTWYVDWHRVDATILAEVEVYNYFISRSYVYFDTDNLPDDAEITSAVLSLYGYVDESDVDFDVVIQEGMPTAPHDPLILDDFQFFMGDGGSFNTSDFTTEGYNNMTMTELFLDWINKTGTTKFCLRSSRDIDSTPPVAGVAEGVYFYSYEKGDGYWPMLVVEWSTAITLTQPTQYPDPTYGIVIIMFLCILSLPFWLIRRREAKDDIVQ